MLMIVDKYIYVLKLRLVLPCKASAHKPSRNIMYAPEKNIYVEDRVLSLEVGVEREESGNPARK